MSMVNRGTTTADLMTEWLTTHDFQKTACDAVSEARTRFPEASWNDIEEAFVTTARHVVNSARDWDDPKGPSVLEMFR